MRALHLASLLAALAAFFMPVNTLGQQRECPTRTAALDRLAKKYNEHSIWQGINTAGVLVELTVSKDGGTWTLIVTRKDQTTCMITSGEGWREAKPPDGPET